jgi:DNA gyrase/topoisomerase IV subunit B
MEIGSHYCSCNFYGQRKGEIPVEVALIYNIQVIQKIFSYVNNINTHEGGTHYKVLELV